MKIIKKRHLSLQDLDKLTNKLLSYRLSSYESGLESLVNLIIGVDIPKNQDFIRIVFVDGTSTIVWLDNWRLPEINYELDAKPNLPVMSLSSFTEKVLNTIIRAFYEVDN